MREGGREKERGEREKDEGRMRVKLWRVNPGKKYLVRFFVRVWEEWSEREKERV